MCCSWGGGGQLTIAIETIVVEAIASSVDPGGGGGIDALKTFHA